MCVLQNDSMAWSKWLSRAEQVVAIWRLGWVEMEWEGMINWEVNLSCLHLVKHATTFGRTVHELIMIRPWCHVLCMHMLCSHPDWHVSLHGLVTSVIWGSSMPDPTICATYQPLCSTWGRTHSQVLRRPQTAEQVMQWVVLFCCTIAGCCNKMLTNVFGMAVTYGTSSCTFSQVDMLYARTGANTCQMLISVSMNNLILLCCAQPFSIGQWLCYVHSIHVLD